MTGVTPRKRNVPDSSGKNLCSPPKREPQSQTKRTSAKSSVPNDATKSVKRELFNNDEDDVCMETFKDEFALLSTNAAEHYFLQGKTIRMNRGRGGRKKANKRGENEERLDDEENVEDKTAEKKYQQFEHCDLEKLRDYMENADDYLPEAVLERNKNFESQFEKWRAYLIMGFNLLLHGVGSKRELIKSFREKVLDNYTAFMVDGFREEASAKALLSALDENLKLKCPMKRRSLNEWAGDIIEHISTKGMHIYLLINNLDGPNFREPADVAVICSLAACENISIVGSIDHVNASLIWNTRSLAKLNFLYIRASTMMVPNIEIMARESVLLGINSKSSATTHSLSSLDVMWASLPANSKKIFRLFFAVAFSTNASVSFWDLFEQARDKFLVSSDAALRQQLVEFEDHKIIKSRRSEDHTERISPAVDRELIEKFLAEKGMTLDVDDD